MYVCIRIRASTAPLGVMLLQNVCLGSIMVTATDFQSGRLGSSPCRDHFSMKLDRGTVLIRALIPPGYIYIYIYIYIRFIERHQTYC